LTTSQKEAEKKYKAKLHVRKEWLLYHVCFNLSQLLAELLDLSSAAADLIYRLITREKVLWLSVQKSIRNEILCPSTFLSERLFLTGIWRKRESELCT